LNLKEILVERVIEKPAIVETTADAGISTTLAAIAWVVAAIGYFYQYVLRSSPSVMIPELSSAFGISAISVASLVGIFYYGYSPFSLVAGAAMDRFGPRVLVPLAAATMGLGALLFSTGNQEIAMIGRFLQGTGGAFAAVGAMFIAVSYFPPSKAATLLGATQMFGMAGGSAGQFAVGPLIAGGLVWSYYWVGMAGVALVLATLLVFIIPKQPAKGGSDDFIRSSLSAIKVVLTNPHSLLCGAISGLLFIPTTIFDMIWGVRFLQEAYDMDYGMAVMRSAAVPLGWIIGCPLLGFISDRLGRRKPVIIAGALVLMVCIAWILYGPSNVLPPYTVALIAGIASGAAMVPYTVIKEVNLPKYSGTATGAVNFLNFTFSALLGPVFGWFLVSISGDAKEMNLSHYQTAFTPLLYGVGLAIILTLFLKETGWAVSNKFKAEPEEAFV
jgi:MFS family permease